MLNGDGELTWGPDPELSDIGIAQAKRICEVWGREMKDGAPVKKGQMKW